MPIKKMPLVAAWYLIKVRGIPHYIHAWYVITIGCFDDDDGKRYKRDEVTHWLEKKENVYVLDEREMKQFLIDAFNTAVVSNLTPETFLKTYGWGNDKK